MNIEIEHAQKKIEFWEETVQDRRKTVTGFLSFLASETDKEDLRFAEGKLREAKAELQRFG